MPVRKKHGRMVVTSTPQAAAEGRRRMSPVSLAGEHPAEGALRITIAEATERFAAAAAGRRGERAEQLLRAKRARQHRARARARYGELADDLAERVIAVAPLIRLAALAPTDDLRATATSYAERFLGEAHASQLTSAHAIAAMARASLWQAVTEIQGLRALAGDHAAIKSTAVASTQARLESMACQILQPAAPAPSSTPALPALLAARVAAVVAARGSEPTEPNEDATHGTHVA